MPSHLGKRPIAQTQVSPDRHLRRVCSFRFVSAEGFTPVCRNHWLHSTSLCQCRCFCRLCTFIRLCKPPANVAERQARPARVRRRCAARQIGSSTQHQSEVWIRHRRQHSFPVCGVRETSPLTVNPSVSRRLPSASSLAQLCRKLTENPTTPSICFSLGLNLQRRNCSGTSSRFGAEILVVASGQ
jgi:hypothetical protein